MATFNALMRARFSPTREDIAAAFMGRVASPMTDAQRFIDASRRIHAAPIEVVGRSPASASLSGLSALSGLAARGAFGAVGLTLFGPISFKKGPVYQNFTNGYVTAAQCGEGGQLTAISANKLLALGTRWAELDEAGVDLSTWEAKVNAAIKAAETYYEWDTDGILSCGRSAGRERLYTAALNDVRRAVLELDKLEVPPEPPPRAKPPPGDSAPPPKSRGGKVGGGKARLNDEPTTVAEPPNWGLYVGGAMALGVLGVGLYFAFR